MRLESVPRSSDLLAYVRKRFARSCLGRSELVTTHQVSEPFACALWRQNSMAPQTILDNEFITIGHNPDSFLRDLQKGEQQPRLQQEGR